jgi:dTDP-4-amino-4,6-dideoxygalactose transaminase
VARFERELERYLDAAHVRCVSSCSAALFLSLAAMEIGPGDEVIVPAMTFVASANAVEHVGATTVLVDCEPDNGLIDLDAAEAAITPRTRVIMPVHLAGRPVDIDRLAAIRDRHGVAILEDAAHAIGAEWQGRRVGANGNLCAFSFYVTKNITTGEGGAIATEDKHLTQRVERMAMHGMSQGAWQRQADPGFRHYVVEEPGWKFNMTDINASIGLRQLPKLDRWIDERAARWNLYDDLLESVPIHRPLPPEPHTRHARHLYRIEVEDGQSPRDEILDSLWADGVGCGVHYRGVHLHPYYRAKYELRPEQFPNATRSSERTLSLPLDPALTEQNQRHVVAALRRALRTPR